MSRHRHRLPRRRCVAASPTCSLSVPVAASGGASSARRCSSASRPAQRRHARLATPPTATRAGQRNNLKELEAKQKERNKLAARTPHRAGRAELDKRQFYSGQRLRRRLGAACSSWPRTNASAARPAACSSARFGLPRWILAPHAQEAHEPVPRRIAERDGRHRARHPVRPAARRLHAHRSPTRPRSRCETEFRSVMEKPGDRHADRRGGRQAL